MKQHSAVWSIRATGWAVAAVCMLVIAASGCRGGDVPGTATTQQASPSPAAPAAAAPVAQVRTVTAKQIRALVHERRGKVVVVNFWASWCPPCMREFPAIIKVFEHYREEGVEMFAVSLNDAEDKADIEQFVQTYKPPFPIFLRDAKDETFTDGVLQNWSGEMPLTLVFDTTGKRVLAHKSELTFEELSKKVEPLLRRSSSTRP